VASLPVIVAAVRGVSDGWFPYGDRAVIATRAIDVLTVDTPLLGQYSASSDLTGEPTYSLGPLLYWLLALPARIGADALAVTVAALNVAAVVGAVALARRRGGLPLMFATAAATAVMCGSLGAETFHEVWNPAVGVLPLLALVFLCWSIACGERELLPLAVLVASFLAQAHLTFALPAAGLIAVAAAGLTLARRWTRRAGLGAIGVTAVCWSLPLIEQAIHRPGNLVRVARAAGERGPTLGAGDGWSALSHTVGAPPWWLRAPRSPFERLSDLANGRGALATIVTVAILLGLLAVAAAGARRRRADLVAAGAIGLLLCAAIFAGTAGTPGRSYQSVTYSLYWASPAGMAAWLLLGWGAAVSLAARRDRGRAREAPRPPGGLRAAAPALALACTALAGLAVGLAADRDEDRAKYDPLRATTARLHERLGGAGRVAVEASDTDPAFDFATATVYRLRREGAPVASRQLSHLLGSRYDEPGRPLRVHDRAAGRPPPGTLLATGTVRRTIGLGFPPRPTPVTERVDAILGPAP
jgi:hypothetical protein